ncbi:MAG TPA: hypothetical protein VEO00_05610 [Actinomycetota bacterium]|nr:hypothetical protein [Actinomycetota bacterium]
MATSPGFDMSRMSTASKILIGASALFFIDGFLPWQRVCIDVGIPGIGGCASASLWSGIGFLAALLGLALLVWEGLRVAGVNLGTMPEATKNMISAGLAAGVVLFTALKVLIDNEAIAYGAWIGIILALAIGYGGFMRWQESKTATPMPPAAPPPPPPA